MSEPSKKKPKRKAASKKKPVVIQPVAVESIGADLSVNQDLFCTYYVVNDDLRNNGTLSYAAAYGYDLDNEQKYPRDDALYEEEENEPGDQDPDERTERARRLRKRYGGRFVIIPSSYDRAYETCASNASRLLRNDKVQQRLVELRNALLTDEVVDSRLAFLITQGKELGVSLSAIKEFNKLRGRTKDIVEISGPGGGPVQLDDTRRSALDGLLTKNAGSKP